MNAKAMTDLPLAGVRVTDFSWIGAGSYLTKLLADLGADVIKIESSAKLDALRVSPPFKDRIKGVNRSGYFSDRNTSKRSMTVNVKTPAGLALIRRLVAVSDIVANNFAPGTMDKLGLGYEQLKAINPRIIHIGMSMHGAAGPEANTIGYGLTIGAISGLQYLCGSPEREPVGSGTNYPDHVPNPCHGAFAVLAALRHQRRTGLGQNIDMAQTEPMIALLAPAMIDCAVNARDVPRAGNRSADRAPRGVFRCCGEDRWIAISIGTDKQWRSLCEVLGFPADRESWRTASGRLAEQDDIEKALAASIAAWDAFELMERLQARGVPAGVMQTAADVIERDPQLAHRSHWRKLAHPEMGDALHNAQPFKFARVTVGPLSAAPCLGEHTEEICRTLLGLSPQEIADLQRNGVLS